MNDFSSYDDADWELASAYLDNEATPDERVRVEASPALLDLVATLRRVAVTVALSPTSPAGVDDIIANAVAAADGTEAATVEPTVGSGALPPPEGTTSPNETGGDRTALPPVVSLDVVRRRRRGILRGPALLAAALVTLFGLGFVLRPSNEMKSTSGKMAATSSGTTAAAGATTAAAATTAADGAAAPRSTEQVSGPTTAAAAATTAPPAALTSSPTTSGSASTTTTFLSPLAPPVPALTTQELQDLVIRSKDAQTTEVCPDPAGLPRRTVLITWKDQPAVLFVDPVANTLVILSRDSCQVIAVIPLKDIAQS